MLLLLQQPHVVYLLSTTLVYPKATQSWVAADVEEKGMAAAVTNRRKTSNVLWRHRYASRRDDRHPNKRELCLQLVRRGVRRGYDFQLSCIDWKKNRDMTVTPSLLSIAINVNVPPRAI
jgi:hypothetical protein